MIKPFDPGVGRRTIERRLASAAAAGQLHAAAYGMLRADLAVAAAAVDTGDTETARYALRRALTVEHLTDRIVVQQLVPGPRAADRRVDAG